MVNDRMTNDEIKIEYDKKFDAINQVTNTMNSLDSNRFDPEHVPYFEIKPESERLKNPTYEDLKDLQEELETINSIDPNSLL
jgi:hypothetical protein